MRSNYYRDYMRYKREAEKPLRTIEQIKVRFMMLDGHYKSVCLASLFEMKRRSK